MTPIELPIFHHSDQSYQAKELGMDFDHEDCEVRSVTFYHINAISPYHEDEQDKDSPPFSSIHANGSEYICPIPYNKLKDKILKAINDDRPFT